MVLAVLAGHPFCLSDGFAFCQLLNQINSKRFFHFIRDFRKKYIFNGSVKLKSVYFTFVTTKVYQATPSCLLRYLNSSMCYFIKLFQIERQTKFQVPSLCNLFARAKMLYRSKRTTRYKFSCPLYFSQVICVLK